MYPKFLMLLFLMGTFFSCNNSTTTVSDTPPQRYLFYLHGRIIEEQGINAISDQFGRYEYTAIIDTLQKHQFTVLSEARPKNTDIPFYANQLTKEVLKLIDTGIAPQNISILGASKGAVIATLTSTQLANPNINFILLGNCNEWVADNFELNLHGSILSIYEETDSFGGSCEGIIENSTGIRAFKEISIHTKLDHGFLYRPLKEWVIPAVDWAKEQEKTNY